MTPDGLACVPWIDPAETLYSYCVFVHRFNRLPSSAASARLMLRAAHATRQHDVPAALTPLTQFGGAAFPEPLKALLQHTVAGYYWPFMSEERKRTATAAFLSPKKCVGLRLLNASTRRLSVSHPLKWCPACLEADLQMLGRPCWRTQHQHPTTFVCSLHCAPLLGADSGGRTWKWPNEGQATVSAAFSPATATLAAVGVMASSLDAIDLTSLRAVTVNRLAELGVLHSRHSVRHERLQKWFSSTAIGRWLPTAPNGLQSLQSGEWIAKQIWRRPSAHAVRWTALWSALEWDSADGAARRFHAACQSGGYSTHGTAGPLKQGWPRISAPPAFEAAINECLSYEAIATRLGATRSDVVRWFEAYPCLRAQWRSGWLAHRKAIGPEAPQRADESLQPVPATSRTPQA